MGAYTYSTTAASNTSIDGLGNNGAVDPPSNIDNLVGRLAAAQATLVRDLGGANTSVGGTADAITVSLADPSTASAYFDGMIFSFRAASDSTSTAPTLNVDSIGTKTIKKAIAGVESALVAGDIQAGGTYTVVYRSAWATAAGAFELLNPHTINGNTFSAAALPTTSDGAALGSTSAMWSDVFLASGAVINWNNGNVTQTHSAAAMDWVGSQTNIFSYNGGPVVLGVNRLETLTNDTIGRLDFRARDSAANTDVFARILGYSIDASSTNEDGSLYFGWFEAGTLADRVLMTGTSLSPVTNDQTSLGTATVSWSDLFLASGGVINWNNGAGGTLTGPASASDQETATSTSTFVAPGTQHRHPSAAKVWGMTTGGGTPSLDGSYNMTGITDAGIGTLTVTFATDFSGATWGGAASVACSTNANRMCALVTRAAGSVNIESSSATTTLADPGGGYAWAFFGDQT